MCDVFITVVILIQVFLLIRGSKQQNSEMWNDKRGASTRRDVLNWHAVLTPFLPLWEIVEWDFLNPCCHVFKEDIDF